MQELRDEVKRLKKIRQSKEDRSNAEKELRDLMMMTLEDPSLLTEGKSGIQSELDSLEKDVDNLKSAAKTDYQPQVDAVKSSIDDLKTAVKDVGNGSLTDNVQDIGKAITKVGSTTETLLNQLKAACPSS